MKTCVCRCGEQHFQVRLRRDEQLGLLTCAAGHHSLLLDSKDYWADVTQGRKPKLSRCRCGEELFAVDVCYELRTDGEVRKASVSFACVRCGQAQRPLRLEIKYAPTDALTSMPLDAVEDPWLHAKRTEITSYWKPEDAVRFATYLVETLGGVLHRRNDDGSYDVCSLDQVKFLPALRHALCFGLESIDLKKQSLDPEKTYPVLHLTRPYNILWSISGPPAMLHYISYCEEYMDMGLPAAMPEQFVRFARAAREWLLTEYCRDRAKNAADNADEYRRNFPDRHS